MIGFNLAWNVLDNSGDIIDDIRSLIYNWEAKQYE